MLPLPNAANVPLVSIHLQVRRQLARAAQQVRFRTQLDRALAPYVPRDRTAPPRAYLQALVAMLGDTQWYRHHIAPIAQLEHTR